MKPRVYRLVRADKPKKKPAPRMTAAVRAGLELIAAGAVRCIPIPHEEDHINEDGSVLLSTRTREDVAKEEAELEAAVAWIEAQLARRR